MERQRLNGTLMEFQIMVEGCIRCHEANIPVEHRPAWRQMVKVHSSSLLERSRTRPSHSDVLQVVLSSFVYVKPIRNENPPLKGNLEELLEGSHRQEKRCYNNEQRKNEEEEGSAIVVTRIGTGQTSDLCEIDNVHVFKYAKDQLH